ncbi:serine/threonine protein kinase [Mycobacterium sp. MS1601]|nr:serine/threonine protein kinase [Mycobacterium sp. MS1601]
MPHPAGDFNGYAIGKVLGHGGSATVYLARQLTDGDREVALKVLAPGHRTESRLTRISREFDFARQLDHPHIIEMYDRGPDWLAMQYVDGGNVATLHSVDLRLQALAQIADALDFVHRHGIVHCDVKPANILVHKDFGARGAVLIDFGVAHSVAADMAQRLSRDVAGRLSLDPAKRITHAPTEHAATVQASLPYAAPELLSGRTPSAATDEYALACTAVELITGTTPFVAPTAGALIDAQLRQPPPKISRQLSWVPHAFDSILAKALAKDPDARYETCAEMVALITRVLRRREHD